ncbi:Ubiquitin carboxyl-terminal hydrolase 12, partial [Auxenochlorella protothecoides]
WELRDFSQQPLKTFSEVFDAGGFPWQLLCFPKGNKPGQLSLFLAVPENEDQPMGWQRSASFKLTVLSAHGREHDVSKDATHTFLGTENDWGFNTFMLLNDLVDPSRGLLVDDTLRIKASCLGSLGSEKCSKLIPVEVEVRVPEDFSYDSRKETGYVGLKNQGATCYMNSLLQTLYNINQFRKAVYHMPTSEDDDPAKSMPLALQSVFYKLQFTDGPVSTKDLTRSFGWDTSDAFQQHDVQELNRILCDRLEEKMKSTRVEGTISKLFEGHTLNYIDCINVDYKSSRRESFMDLQLDVKGCKTILDSFDRYCEVETLEGDNQYLAEGHGLQDARKGVLFDGFPPVLQLQLKRFEYDFMKDSMVKINDRYEFGEELDLDVGDRKYLAASAARGVRNKYKLLAVLVHSGGVHGGHYYAYIRPDGARWLKFDDERVEAAEADRAAEQDEKERRRKEKAEAHLYTLVRVSTDADMASQIGRERWFDLVDHEGNGTYRPSLPLEPESDEVPISSLRDGRRDLRPGTMSTLNLYLETAPDGGGAATPRPRGANDILLFFKQFLPDPEEPALRYAGSLQVHRHSRIGELAPALRALGGLAPDAALEVYEEVKFEPSVMVEALRPALTAAAAQLENGDVLVFQAAAASLQAPPDCPREHLSAPAYMSHVRNRVRVAFRPLESPGEEGLLLDLRKDMGYEEVSGALAARLGLDHPLRLALTGQNPYSALPRPAPLKYAPGATLEEMLRAGQYGAAAGSTLYYEVIDLPLPEYEKLVTFKVSFHNAKAEEVSAHSVRLPRDARVSQLLEELRAQLPAGAGVGDAPLRLMEVYQWRVWQLFDPDQAVGSMSGDALWHLRAEVVPPDQRGAGGEEGLHVHCLQVTEEAHNRAFAFSDPFIMRVREGETVGELRRRVQVALGVGDEEFAGWRALLCPPLSAPEPLEDEEVVTARLARADLERLYGHHDRACIGWEHENRNPRKTHAHLNRNAAWYGQERQLKIKA